MIYCRQPFSNVRLDTGPVFKPCCHYKEDISASNVMQYISSTELKHLQTHLLTQAYLPNGCLLCKKQEDKGQESFRQRYNRNAEITDQTSISHFEIFINNTCNLKCFMCSPEYSTALGSEHRALGWITQYPTYNHYEQALASIETLPDLKSISFIGGEFFFAKESLDLLELAVKRNLSVSIATNASVIMDKHVELLKQLPAVDIQVSLDGIASSYEFMRYPASWSTVSENIKTLRLALPRQRLHISTVAQPLNVVHVAELAEWCNQHLLPVSIVNLQAPFWLEWRILTSNEKTLIQSKINGELSQRKLTSHQRETLTKLLWTMNESTFDSAMRFDFIKKMREIFAIRKYTQKQITSHFDGLFNELIEET